MTSDQTYEEFRKQRAPGHILVDEDYVDAVMATVNSPEFEPLPDVYTDAPDKAGLVALCWGDDDRRDPIDVVDRIRELAPYLEDMVSPDHTVGLLHTVTGDDAGASVEMGGPAVPAKPTKPTDLPFEARLDSDQAGRGVVVGVVDSGIVGHPWLDGSFLASPGSIDPLDEDKNGKLDRLAGHGVFVAGLILREAPAALVRVVRAFDIDGFVRIRRAANAIVELDELGADVINLSFGGYTRRNRPPLAHRKAFSKIRDTTVVVAAAGNHRPDDEEHVLGRKFWPGALDRVVAVAALDTASPGGVRMAPFSNLGTWVSLAAPGADVVSTYVNSTPFKGWARWSGTSFAAPVVTGRIAAAMTNDAGLRVRSAQKAKEQVIEQAAQIRPPGLAIGPDVVERIILPRQYDTP
jgi:subtilisin family serine protease